MEHPNINYIADKKALVKLNLKPLMCYWNHDQEIRFPSLGFAKFGPSYDILLKDNVDFHNLSSYIL